MKVILLSRWFNLKLKISIRKGSERRFSELLDYDLRNDDCRALRALMSDMGYYFEGYDPVFISRYTAKRIVDFYSSDDTNYFISVAYENR